jgi:hypothetical protein
MNDEEKIIGGVLADVSLDTLRKETLQSGLEAVRSKARRRRLMRGAALGCLPAILALLLFWERFQPNAVEETRISTATPSTSKSTQAPNAIERIDDRELLALFPDQTVALIGPPGREQFLVFSERPQIR